MKLLHRLQSAYSILGKVALLAGALSLARTAMATPYASYVTNNSGTIQFYINEPGANITVTYEDGSTNANFDGLTQGTNTPSGMTNFLLGTHSSYKISVTKIGSGTPSLIKSLSLSGNPRGVDVNKNVKSPYFGRVYEVNGGGSPAGVYVLNPDLTYTYTNVARNAGVTTFGSGGTGTGQSPYRLSVAGDDTVIIGDASENGAAIYQLDPTVTTNQLMLGPVGYLPTIAHGTIESRPIITGSLAKGNLVLYQIDGELTPVNSIQVYDIGSGPLPWTKAPTYTGYQVGVGVDSIGLGGNEYCGLTMGTNGYLYCSTYRNNLSNPLIQVYDTTGLTNYWNSWTPDQTTYPGGSPSGDYFLTPISGITQGVVDSAVSLDGNYVVAVNIDNGVLVCPLTNGIPNPVNLYTVPGTSTVGNARGLAMDAADNFYMSSSGIGAVQAWSLGITAHAITTGNASGQTNFALVLPSTTVSVVATTPLASQNGPTSGVFTITRTDAQGNYTSPITVNFTLTGAAVNGASYTVSPASATGGTIVLAAGMTSTNITIIPVTDGVSRPTTTVTLALKGGSAYTTAAPLSDTVSIQNNGPQVLLISQLQSATIYKGLTNDPGYFVVTRYGDTNNATYFASGFSYAGSATSAEYVPAGTMEFDPGTISVTNFITPLIDTTNYVGTRTVTIGLTAGTGFTVSNNVVTIGILDNEYPPATLLYQDPLTDPNDATNWGVAAANNNEPNNGIDNNIDFGYDLTSANGLVTQNGLITPPPNGATTALRVTVNKNSAEGAGAAAGVNLYLTNLFLKGDYAVRFSMNVVEGYNANYTTEGPLYGINHSGNDTNWWTGSGIATGASPSVWSSDGIWYWSSVDGGASEGDYIEFTGLGGTNGNTGWTELGTEARALYGHVFENPVPYSTTGGAGLVGNDSPSVGYADGADTNSWADVEIKTVHNLVTLSINKTVIYTYTNTTVFTNGYLMLGYEDPFSSVGAPDAAVYYSGLTVVSLGSPTVVTQPTNFVAGVGSPAAFSAAFAFPSTSYYTNYQWLFNGVPIAGATNTLYSFTVAKTSFGNYALSVSDGNATVVTTNASLTPPPLVIVTPPANVIAAVTGSAKFTVVAQSFSGTTNYQWYTNSVSIGGATSSTLTLSGLTTVNFGLSYTVSAGDGFVTVTSTPAAHLIAAASPTISSPSLATGKFTLSFGSQVGPSYVVDYKTNLTQAAWVPISTNAGTGSAITVTNNGTNTQGYYIIQLK